MNDNMRGCILPSIKDAAVRSTNRNLQKGSLGMSDFVEQIPFYAAFLCSLEQDFVELDQPQTEILIADRSIRMEWGSTA